MTHRAIWSSKIPDLDVPLTTQLVLLIIKTYLRLIKFCLSFSMFIDDEVEQETLNINRKIHHHF